MGSQPPSTSQKILDPWLDECRLSPLTQGHFALAEKVRNPPFVKAVAASLDLQSVESAANSRSKVIAHRVAT